MPFIPKTLDKPVADFMSEARERYAAALAAEQADRAEAVDDLRFAAAIPDGNGGTSQWHPEALKQRRGANRPILTENRLPTFINQVVNDGRQNKPSIRITPMDGATKETAEMLQSRIRHIEYESDAEIAYDTSRKHQVTCGRGFIRVTTRYADDKSFDQEPRIERIANQFSVVFGPAKEYDCSDAEYCFVTTRFSKQEFERRFGKDTVVGRLDSFASPENPAPDWIGVGNGQEVQVAEYWLKKYTKRTLCQLANGETKFKDELPEDAVIVDERPVDDCKVYQYIVDGAEILDETEFAIPEIPIRPLWGQEEIVDGRRRTTSLVRFAKDPQRLLNLYVSNIAEIITLTPKNPYKAPVGTIDGHEDIWQNINLEARTVVPYNQYDAAGRKLDAPSRELAEPPIQALTVGYMQAVDALKASMGIFDPSLGAQGNETSGIAIQRRQREADNANFHFHDNEARTRKSIGRILLALLKKLDAGEKIVTVRSEDGKTRSVRINTAQPYLDPETGETVHHQLDKGDYGVAISTGPSYTSARQEAFDTYSQIAQADQNFMQVAGDVLFDNLDAPGSERIAERYRRGVIPPQVQDQKGQQNQIPPQMQAQIQSLMQQHEQLTRVVEAQSDEIKTRKAETDSRERIAAMQEETKRTIALAQLQSQEGLELLRQEIASVKHQLDMQHAAGMKASDQEHQSNMTAAQQQHEAAMSQQSQDFQAAQKTQDQEFQAQQAEQQPQPAAGE